MSQKSNDYEVVLRDPQTVLRKQLGNNLVVLDYETVPFVKAGDHYGSTILKLRILVRKGEMLEEFDLVAKMLPPTDFQRTIFESLFTFKKEIFFYQDLIPSYRKLYRGDFEVTPELYGCRLSLKKDATEIDEDAVIIMENLKIKGYCMENRHKGLNLEYLKIAIKALAKFHAIGLSVKHKNPGYLPTLKKYAKKLMISEEIMTPYLLNIFNAIENDKKISSYIDRVKVTGNFNNLRSCYYTELEPEDPWACVVHGDFWVNNVLFHRELEDVKFVDFQTYYMSSPLTDVIFFLCTSIEMPLIHLDDMLELYRLEVLKILKKLDCNLDLFAKESFDARLKLDAAHELFHIIMMTQVIELEEGGKYDQSPLNQSCMNRLRRIIEIFVDKKWI